LNSSFTYNCYEYTTIFWINVAPWHICNLHSYMHAQNNYCSCGVLRCYRNLCKSDMPTNNTNGASADPRARILHTNTEFSFACQWCKIIYNTTDNINMSHRNTIYPLVGLTSCKLFVSLIRRKMKRITLFILALIAIVSIF